MTSDAQMTSMVQQSARWYAGDRDGATMIMTTHVPGDDDVLVEWDDVNGGWTCSVHGSFGVEHPSAKVTCPHTMAAGRRLPLDVALRMAPQVMNKNRQPSTTEGAKPVGRKVELEGIAATLEAGAAKRAEEAKRHDEHHRVITSEVTVRQMTDEDRARLEERRRRKRLCD